MSSKGRGKRDDFEIYHSTLFLTSLRKNWLTKPNLAGVISEPKWPGKGKYPISLSSTLSHSRREKQNKKTMPPHSRHSVLPKVGGGKKRNWEESMEFIIQKHMLTKRLRLNHRMLSLLSQLTITLLKGLFTWHIMSSYQ